MRPNILHILTVDNNLLRNSRRFLRMRLLIYKDTAIKVIDL